MENCIFCKIIKGEIPCHKIYEDDKTLAFLDIANDIYGHTLVIPKNHCRNLLDASAEDMKAVMQTVQKIGMHYIENCEFDGFNVLNANEPAAEQSVFHLHMHILPRDVNDGKQIYPKLEKLDESLYNICEKLKID